MVTIPTLLRENFGILLYNQDGSNKQPSIKCNDVIINLEDIDLSAIIQAASYSIIIEDAHVATCQDFLHAFGVVFAVHYVFNLSYNEKIKSTMLFVQKLILDLEDNFRPPTTVLNLMSKVKKGNPL